MSNDIYVFTIQLVRSWTSSCISNIKVIHSNKPTLENVKCGQHFFVFRFLARVFSIKDNSIFRINNLIFLLFDLK